MFNRCYRFFGDNCFSARFVPSGSEGADRDCYVQSHDLDQAIVRADKILATYIDSVEQKMGVQNQYGFSLAVSVCGKTVWKKAAGFSDLENAVAVTDKTKFRVGSVSKTFTSIAMGQLVEAGKLDLDKKIQAYVPTFPKKEYPVTVRQVAGHLGGIRHYNDEEEVLSAKHYGSVLEALEIFRDDPLVNAPGSAYTYSSYGWNLMSAVVEGASGENFLDYMRNHVFSKAGMDNTVADKNSQIIPNRTGFYHYDEGVSKNRNAPFVDLSNKWAGGGFLSTPENLMRFAHAMQKNELITSRTFTLLTTGQKTTTGENTGYGIGWFTDRGPHELERMTKYFSNDVTERTASIIGDSRLIGHSGGSVGGLTLFLMAPQTRGKVAVAAVSNNSELFPAFILPIAAEFIVASGQD